MIDKLYLSGGDVKISEGENMFLDITLKTGEEYHGVQAVRLFPVSAKNKYLALVDSDRKEIAILKDANSLDDQSKKALQDFLAQYYVVPKIQKVKTITWRYGTLTVCAETNYGERTFKVRNRPHNIHAMGGKVLIRDINDNRYEIDAGTKLDKKSIELLLL